MSVAALSHQLRQSLEESSNAASLEQGLSAVDAFVIECSSCDESEVLLFQLEEELQTIHNEVVDHTSLSHTALFLAVLYRLRPLLSSTSVISTWFDLALRPALREPKLPTTAVNHAKELVIFATERVDERYPEKVGEFRRRLLDLYLLDAYNEGSGDDVLEWAEMDQGQREKRSLWKCNLQDVLVKLGLQRPNDLMTVINGCFMTPSSRLQLLILLNYYTSEPAFQSLAAVLADHPLVDSLLNSLLLDNSSTVCTIGLTVLVKLLPIFAVQACEDLKVMLPRLLAILARVICWKERSASTPPPIVSPTQEDQDPADVQPETTNDIVESAPALVLRPDFGWERLELTFNAASSAPPSGTYFSCLYYLFPCNLLRFFRAPAAYLNDRGYETPYTVNWDDALDEDNIRSKSEFLLRGRIVNPRVIWRDWTKELSEPDTWANYNVSRIASECMMLDVRNTALGIRHTMTALEPEDSQLPAASIIITNEDDTSTAPTPHPAYAELPPMKTRVSLQNMITTSVALKSNLDVDIESPSTAWSSVLFPLGTGSPSKSIISLPPEPGTSKEQEQLPSHVAEAISALQREVLLLRNELNFELWLSRENVQHVGRLYQDRILSKNAEVERQGLYNKLRQYKAQVQSLDRELREHKEQSSSAKNKYADWNTELQKKLREFREEKKSWISEAAALRTAEKESKALFVAQGKLLADALKEVFELQTQKKETQHKIDRLRDYERQIEQHIRMQKLWDADFEKFNNRAEELQEMKSKYKQMELQLESFEKTQSKMDDEARCYRRQNQALEARLALAQKKNEVSRHLPEAEITAFVSEKASLTAANARLREENAELKDEIEEMRAMLEVLKGRKGLVSEPRSSPTLIF
ncbi:hypothetical protein BV22DRAFT_1090648 [Leucogyrophana mollusca]|uniref:Uncharacterized protein n=1 Tax=Leucogyrophana mollusca TaxID=85980 RepID=A0ACB8BGS5_9AGAM|nr:hypothetical protein BV22DRAFT_1090648 [Leucogyrophana mollusca]